MSSDTPPESVPQSDPAPSESRTQLLITALVSLGLLCTGVVLVVKFTPLMDMLRGPADPPDIDGLLGSPSEGSGKKPPKGRTVAEMLHELNECDDKTAKTTLAYLLLAEPVKFEGKIGPKAAARLGEYARGCAMDYEATAKKHADSCKSLLDFTASNNISLRIKNPPRGSDFDPSWSPQIEYTIPANSPETIRTDLTKRLRDSELIRRRLIHLVSDAIAVVVILHGKNSEEYRNAGKDWSKRIGQYRQLLEALKRK